MFISTCSEPENKFEDLYFLVSKVTKSNKPTIIYNYPDFFENSLTCKINGDDINK